MKKYVFDSYAIIAFYANEKGASIVERALGECIEGQAQGWISVINWGEVFYAIAKVKGKKTALQVIQDIEWYPLGLVEADRTLTWEAAQLKAKYPIAYANCFAIALAKQKEARLLTGDPGFKKIEENIKIIWLK